MHVQGGDGGSAGTDEMMEVEAAKDEAEERAALAQLIAELEALDTEVCVCLLYTVCVLYVCMGC